MPISSDTFDFLKDLTVNNNRPWFEKNKKRFTKAKKNFSDFVEELKAKMAAHDVIEKAKIFRIYRDVRFSADKTPYKNSMSVGFTRAGALRRGGYYFHYEPGSIFVGGGFWDPNPADLKRIRDEFARDDAPIRKIISDKNFIKHFGKLEGEGVKTAPKGFDRDHPAIDLIRMKQFTASEKFTEAEALHPDFADKVNDSFKALRPFFDYMTEVLTTDLNGELIV